MPESKIWEVFQQQKAVSTDTRKIKRGDIYFALKGDNFDGNRFAQQALDAGAAFAVVDDSNVVADDRFILVANVLLALQHLGRRYRETFDIPVIGITGSNGKTTSKELVHAVLSSETRAYSTRGNLNNHIGVPLTLLAMPAETEIAVIEMGANKPRDIEELVNIALPTVGIITNIGQAHLEGMGGMEGVQRTKGEMFDFIRAHNGLAFVNENDFYVVEVAKGIAHTIGYGGANSSYRILSLSENTETQIISLLANGKPLTVTIQLLGPHNAENALLAVAVGQHFGISDAGIQRALAEYVPLMNRSQQVRVGDRSFLLDAYNANPSSMMAAISSIARQNHTHVALVLGDMFELGPDSPALHRDLLVFARKTLPSALIVGVGPLFQGNAPLGDAMTKTYSSVQEANDHILHDLEGYDFVLIKGSRGMALERLLPALGVRV